MQHGPRSTRRWSAVVAAVLAGLVAVAGSATAQTIPDAETLVARDVVQQVLTTATQDPTAIQVADDGRVIFAERKGNVKIWHQDGTLVTAGRIGVDASSGQCSDCPGRNLDEGGLHGLALSPGFNSNHQIYTYYSVPNSLDIAPNPPKHPGARGPQDTEGLFRLSRFTLDGDVLDLASEEILFENPAEWFHCCHYGGDMDWLPDGTMLLSVGDDTISSQSGGFAPRDARLGYEYNSAEKTSQNLADRRGKLLRIDVEDVDSDGSMLPTNNPFRANPAADPYVYALGFRSNYRFGVDPVTGTAYVGTVGPDGKTPDQNRGPAAHEEIEVVPLGGGTNHGWPRCIANNIPYNDYDWETNQAGAPLSCEGMTPAAIWYSYNPGTTSPYVQLGFGGTCDAVMGGVAYRRPDTGALRLPPRFDDQLLWMEWCRGVVVSTPITASGQLNNSPEAVKVISSGLRSPSDSTVGPDGAVYITEYAARNYNASNSRITRLTGGGTPTSSDYLGSPRVVNPTTVRARANVIPAASASVEGPIALGVLALLAGVVAVRRRRQLV